MEASRPDHARQVLAACRRAWAGVALFSACLNLLTLAVPLYMMQIYDRVLTTRSLDTLLVLSVMVAGAWWCSACSTPCAAAWRRA